MRIFKCLSQNVSLIQDREEKPERRKYILGFKQKKRRPACASKTNECTNQAVGFISPLKDNELPVAESIVQTNHTPQSRARRSLFVGSINQKELASRTSGSSMAGEEKKSLSTYRSRPTLESTPLRGKSRRVEDCQKDKVDIPRNSVSATTGFFREMNVSMGSYLPSFAVYQSPNDCRDNSAATYSSDANCLDFALTAGSSVSGCSIGGYSSSKTSVRSSGCNSTVDWSSVTCNTTCATESMVNSSAATSNKGCSTSPSFDTSSSYTSIHSFPATFRHESRIRKRSQFTTSDSCLPTARRHDYHHKSTTVDTRPSFKEQDVMEVACDSSRLSDMDQAAVKATSVRYDSVSQAGVGFDSASSTGIDYDYSSIDDSRCFYNEQVTQMETDSSQFSANMTSECPPSDIELKFMYIEQLMSLEHEFVNYMRFGIRKYAKPLQYCILTCYQHQTLFTNIEKLVRFSEANLKSMRDNAAPDDSQTSEDQHMMLYLPATVYELEIQKQCQAYQFYGNELDVSNKLLAELKENQSFLDFVRSQHATREQYKSNPSQAYPSIQEFINRPALHIQQLYTALYNILSVTPQDSHDTPILVRVLETIFNCIRMMKLE